MANAPEPVPISSTFEQAPRRQFSATSTTLLPFRAEGNQDIRRDAESRAENSCRLV